MGAENADRVYGSEEVEEIRRLTELLAPPIATHDLNQHTGLLREAEVIFSGWGGPKLDADFLAAAPKLRAFFYGAGSIKHIVSDEFWNAGIPICAAWKANAIPVGEYAFSQILFSLKCGWHYVSATRKKEWDAEAFASPGAFGSTVGIVSLGETGRLVCRWLSQLDVNVLAYDPYADQRQAEKLDVRLCPLEELFRASDVVSIHAPWLLETTGMIDGELIRSMKKNATLLNTSRGAVINESALVSVLRERPDLFAVLDVTHPEPPPPESPLHSMPNIILTPHIAGSQFNECRRMARSMVDECRRFVQGEALQHEITREKSATMA